MRERAHYFFVIVPLAFFSFFYIFPVAFSIFISFNKWNGFGGLGQMKFVGFNNYLYVFTESRFLNALSNNIKIVILSLAIPVVLGLILAILIDQNVKGETIYKSIIYLPVALSLVISGVVFRWILDPMNGLLNSTLSFLGLGFLAQPWLGQASTALFGILIAVTWSSTGFNMILFLAGLRAIPPEYLEQSRVDGATAWHVFRHIILPLITPATVVVIAFTTLNALKTFDAVFVMTQGGPNLSTDVLGYMMWDYAFIRGAWGLAAAIAVVLFVLTTMPLFLYMRWMMREEVVY